MPSYSKTIVCFADSRKLSGRCIAGKEWIFNQFGNWIRPVGPSPSEEISLNERYHNGVSPQVLDIIRIQMKKAHSHGFQQENHLIDDGYYWERLGSISWGQAIAAVDQVADSIWIDGDSTYNGLNDRISMVLANSLTSSLKLIRPSNLILKVGFEGPPEKRKRKVRASFKLGMKNYNFVVTDCVVEAQYLKMTDGSYPIADALLCISLSEPFNGYTFKLAAAVIIPKTARP